VSYAKYQDEPFTFEELQRWWSLVEPHRRLLLFDALSRGDQQACWDAVADQAAKRTEQENIEARRWFEPYCPECHDRRIEHEPGDCPKYRMPENGIPTSTSSDNARVESDHTDVLKTIAAAAYVMAITGVPVPANGRILCPLHEDAPTPSFKCYGTRWTCFAGCGRGADIYDLAAALTGIEAKSAGFLELRRWIAKALLEGGIRA
jgi:hypothetical protein